MTNLRRKPRRPQRRFSAADKCRAVLTLWTERRSVTELCRELDVKWNVLNQWQEQAMDGMLHALEPKRAVPCGQIPLATRLQSLLERKTARPAAPETAAPSKENRPEPMKRPPTPPRTAEPSLTLPNDTTAQKTLRTA